jgi:hypothetical protein
MTDKKHHQAWFRAMSVLALPDHDMQGRPIVAGADIDIAIGALNTLDRECRATSDALYDAKVRITKLEATIHEMLNYWYNTGEYDFSGLSHIERMNAQHDAGVMLRDRLAELVDYTQPDKTKDSEDNEEWCGDGWA